MSGPRVKPSTVRLVLAVLAFVGVVSCDAYNPVAWGFGVAIALGILAARPSSKRARARAVAPARDRR